MLEVPQRGRRDVLAQQNDLFAKNLVSLFVVLFQTSELLPTDLIGSMSDNGETVSEVLV